MSANNPQRRDRRIDVVRSAGAVVLTALAVLSSLSCSGDPDARKRRHIERAGQYYSEGKFDEASIEYRNALQIDPRSGETQYRYALCALELKRLDVAIPALRNAVDLLPGNVEAKLKLAETYLVAYRFTAAGRDELLRLAKELVEELKSDAADPYEVSRLTARLALAEGRLDTAIDRLKEAHELRPDDKDIVLALTQALIRDGKGGEAEAVARAYLAKDKTAGQLYDTLYVYYFSQRRFAEAEAIAIERAGNLPDRIEARLELAAHYARMDDRGKMGATLDQLKASPDRFPGWQLRLGDFYAGVRDWDAAIGLYQDGAEKNQDNRSVYLQRIGRVWLAKGDPVKAREYVDRSLDLDSDNRETRALNALLRSTGSSPENLDAASKEWQKLISEDPANPAYRYLLGQTLRSKGDTTAAKESLTESININPGFLAPRLALAEASLQAGQFSECAEQAAEVLKRSPNHERALLLRAAALMGLGDSKNAEAALNQYLRVNPGNEKAKFELARLHLAREDFSFAEQVFSEAYSKGEDDLDAILGLADVYSAQKSYQRAFALLADELKRQPESWQLRARLAETAFRLGNTGAAIEQFEYLAGLKPDVAELHLGLARARAKTGDLAGALANAQRAGELQPKNADIQVLIATLLDGQQRPAEALKYYREAVSLNPKHPVALNNLAFRLAESGELAEALEFARRASASAPENPIIADTLGWVYLKMGLNEPARRIFEELVSKDPKNATFRYHLGAVLTQLGDAANARRELEAALRLGPSQDEAREIRKLLGMG